MNDVQRTLLDDTRGHYVRKPRLRYIGPPELVGECQWRSLHTASDCCNNGECPGEVRGICSFGGTDDALYANHDLFEILDQSRVRIGHRGRDE